MIFLLQIPNDFLGDACCQSVLDTANYENLRSWLVSIGFPMYEKQLIDAGWTSLTKVLDLRAEDLQNCGITKKRHLWAISAAIGALQMNKNRIGRF